jgi:tRNA pseudouridine38-40 synthase
VRVEGGIEAAGFVAGDELDAELLEAVDGGVESEPLVVTADGKIEQRMVARPVQSGELPTGEDRVHHFDADIEVVEERAVPVPDEVAIGRVVHEEKTLWTAARRPRNLRAMAAQQNPDEIRRWKCVCAYDGTGFAGWQSQAGGAAVQDVLEGRLAEVFKSPIRIYGSGRTDAGVHANGQVFHFDAEWRHGADKLGVAMRARLPATIQIKSVRPVAADFHARFGATGKRYIYRLHLGDADPFTRPWCWEIFRPLDLAAMEAVAEVLRGRHDFRSFAAFNGTEREDTVRELRKLEIVRRGRHVRITAESEGFLYKMVRSLVGALVAAGEGRLTPEQVRAILASRQRTGKVYTAPPQGLFLDKVFYP